MGAMKSIIKDNAIKELKGLFGAYKHDFVTKPIGSVVQYSLCFCFGMVLSQVYADPVLAKGDDMKMKVKNDD